MNQMDYEKFMFMAFEEAKKSLKEGNKGFGAIIVKENQVISITHDTDNTDQNATSHGEIKVIQMASKILGKNLEGCALFSTHEPCPMCSGAILWSNISEIVYSVSIQDSLNLGRTMIDLSFNEIMKRSPFQVKVTTGILKDQCINLYREEVRDHVKKFRNSTSSDWKVFEEELKRKRLEWIKNNQSLINNLQGDDLEKGYQLLCLKLGINPEEATIVEKSEKKIVFHSQNYCPSLEACKILDIDTKELCKAIYEHPTDALIKSINPKLNFSRSYKCIRPHAKHCEEFIFFD